MESLTWAFMTIWILFNYVQPFSGAHADRVLLTDVKALTLHDGEMTKYRRTSPVPQLTCVGGSAAGAFKPKTVQCINRGSDGYDVQWECKTDMDNSYRFGQVEVTCEGYDYPEDPYILRGSCGLEYTLEFTEEGWARKTSQEHEKYSSGNHYSQNSNTSQISFMQGLVFLLIIAVFTYFIYTKCIAEPSTPPNTPRGNPPSYDEAVRSGNPHDNRQQPSAPPPPGFKPEYIPNAGEGTQPNFQTAPPPQFASNIWSSSTMTENTHHHTHCSQRATPPVTKTETTKASTSSAPHSSGTRTASGFGSTSRRKYTETTTPPKTTTGNTSTTSVPQSTGTRTASGFGGTKRR